MRNLNRVQLIGQLTADPAMTTLQSGQTKATFRMATNFAWKNAQGEWQNGVEYHQVVAWRKATEGIEECKKGQRVYVEGRLHTANWIADDGTKRFSTEVVAATVHPMVASKKKENNDASDDNDAETIDIIETQEEE